MKLYTGCSPNSVKKYHDIDDTHLTSKSLVPTPACSMDLNCGVSGNGSFTRFAPFALVIVPLPLPRLSSDCPMRGELDLHSTNPAKNALIHPIISVCGTIIATLPFIAPIMPSIIAGSPIGFALGFPLASGSARNLPSLNAATV